MVFFLIVPSVMIVSIILTREILRRLGLEISYVTLAMCAILSFVINLVAIALSPIPGQQYFYRLSGLIFVAAIFVTAFNSFFVKSGKIETPEVPDEPAKAKEKIEAAPAVHTTEKEILSKKVAERLKAKENNSVAQVAENKIR